MKKIISIFSFVLVAVVVGCDPIEEEQGTARIYFTQVTGGVATVTPDNVSIDKANKTMTYTFAVSRSGLQPAEGYTVNFAVDNSQVPDGTIALLPEDYTLSTSDGAPVAGEISIPDGKVGKSIRLTIAESVFAANPGGTLALHVRISNASRYAFNDNLSSATLLINVTNFLGAYVDITDDFLKNAKTPFNVTADSPPINKCDPYQQTPTDWVVNDAVKIHEYMGNRYGGVDARCWGGRNWLSAGNYDVYQTRSILDGKIYQTMDLPAGNYRIRYTIGENPGGEGHAALAVAQGSSLPNFADLATAAVAHTEFIATAPGLDFTLAEASTVSLGFVYNIPIGVQGSYAISEIKLSKQNNVFND
jgi:hypothetical protein